MLGAEKSERLELSIRLLKLPPREAEVIQLLCAGWKNPQIAAALMISESAVKHYLARTANRFGICNPRRDRYHWHVQLAVLLTQPPTDPFRQAIEKIYGLGRANVQAA